ncbi:MAG TPA: DUF998 domain-containing protein [Thermoplasmata archaeon]|nr:DUF998 domain-containing protein [Thermoplasmata archaeon]
MVEATVGRRSDPARWGAVLIGLGAAQFVVAMAWVQTAYSGYSLLTNYISDLGNTATSPLHEVFNVSIAILGILAFAGILLAWRAFPPGRSRAVGLPLLLVASLSAILVGAFPENVNPPVHDTVSLLVFLPGGLALVILSAGMLPPSPWSSLRWFSLVLGAVILVSLAYYAPTQQVNTTWDPGLIERLIVAPILLWALGVSVHLGVGHPVRSSTAATP